jgi:putative sterol carrier protein
VAWGQPLFLRIWQIKIWFKTSINPKENNEMSEYTVKQLIYNHEKAFRPDVAEGVNVVIQYHLTGEESGDFIIDIKDGVCKVSEGIADSPAMTLTADGRDFADVLLGKANGMQYFMTGKLKLSGDLNLAMKLTSFFKMG